MADTAPSLYDSLLDQLGQLHLDPDVLTAARFIVGNLDSNGRLQRDPSYLVNDLAFSEGIDLPQKVMDEGLAIVRTLEPHGVGAVSLADCLSIQLEYLPPSQTRDDALRILNEQYEAFSMLHTHLLVSRLKISQERVTAAIDLIRTLDPKPGASIDSTPHSTNTIIPDVIIDTSGMRLRAKVYESVEEYCVLRAVSAINRADVVLFLIDGEKGIRDQDKHVAGLAHEAGKGVIIVYNKWDAVEKDDKTMNEVTKKIREEFKYLSYAPIAFVSALTKSKVGGLIPLIDQVHEACTMRVATNVLNDVIMDAQMMNPPKPHNGRQLRIYYASQVAVSPPSILIFVNDPELFHFSYKRYLENKLRESFGFIGTPIHISARKR